MGCNSLFVENKYLFLTKKGGDKKYIVRVMVKS